MVLGGLLLFIAVFPMLLSGGHGGNEFLVKVALPFAVLGEEPSGRLVVLIAVLQFPVYGAFLGVARYFGRIGLGLLTIAVLHVLAVYACFAF